MQVVWIFRDARDAPCHGTILHPSSSTPRFGLNFLKSGGSRACHGAWLRALLPSHPGRAPDLPLCRREMGALVRSIDRAWSGRELDASRGHRHECQRRCGRARVAGVGWSEGPLAISDLLDGTFHYSIQVYLLKKPVAGSLHLETKFRHDGALRASKARSGPTLGLIDPSALRPRLPLVLAVGSLMRHRMDG